MREREKEGKISLNINGKELRQFCTYSQLRINNIFYQRKIYTNLLGQQEEQDHYITVKQKTASSVEVVRT
jgi:hypothetical protein